MPDARTLVTRLLAADEESFYQQPATAKALCDEAAAEIRRLTLALNGAHKHPEECTEEGGACVSHLAYTETEAALGKVRQVLTEFPCGHDDSLVWCACCRLRRILADLEASPTDSADVGRTT